MWLDLKPCTERWLCVFGIAVQMKMAEITRWQILIVQSPGGEQVGGDFISFSLFLIIYRFSQVLSPFASSKNEFHCTSEMKDETKRRNLRLQMQREFSVCLVNLSASPYRSDMDMDRNTLRWIRTKALVGRKTSYLRRLCPMVDSRVVGSEAGENRQIVRKRNKNELKTLPSCWLFFTRLTYFDNA